MYPSQYYKLELNTARMLMELNIRYPQEGALLERRITQIEQEQELFGRNAEKGCEEAAGKRAFYTYRRSQYR